MSKIEGNIYQDFPASGAKVVVYGAGAIGMTLGGFLAQNGVDVTLIARPRYVEAINREGLVIQSMKETVTTRLKAAETLTFCPDLLLLGVKSQHTLEAAAQFKGFVQGVPVVSLQNGVRNVDLLAGALDKDNVIGGMVAFDARIIKPGIVYFATKDPDLLIIGEAFQKNGERIVRIRELLGRNSAIDVRISENIRAALWSKLIANAGINPFMTLTDLGIEELVRYPQTRNAIVQLIKEGYLVCRQAGIEPEHLPGMPVHLLAGLPAPLVSFMLATVLRWKLKGHDVNGELRFAKDLQRGSTEIDYLNGEIVALSKKIGVQAPMNKKILDLTHRMEKAGRTMSLAELLENL